MADIYEFLEDPTASPIARDASANYAITPADFILQCPAAGQDRYVLHRLIAYIRDTGAIDATGFGNGAALTNGILLRVIDGNTSPEAVLLDLTDGEPIKQNGHWSRHCYDVQAQTWGTGDEFLSARWTFAKAGSPLVLEPGHKLVATMQDDLSGLNEFTLTVQGFTTKNTTVS
jgi:hypothetical protein